MKNLLFYLWISLISFSPVYAAFAGMETGNGISMTEPPKYDGGTSSAQTTSFDANIDASTDFQIEDTVNTARARSLSLHQTTTSIMEFETEDAAIAQALARLTGVDDQFKMYFNEMLMLALNPSRIETDAAHTYSESCACYVMRVAEFDSTANMYLYPVFDHPSHSVTSKASVRIEGAIYLLTRQFLATPDSTLAKDLMLRLLATENNVSEILRLTYAIFPSSLRAGLF
jgi:hypothetical protein